MTKFDVGRRFGFLANEVSRLYSLQFDRLAREKLGLSQAQVRLLAQLALQGGALSQAGLAQRMGLTPMAVAQLCDRMEGAGWLERRASATDRRVNEIHVQPKARKALDGALAIGDSLTRDALAALSAAERAQLLALLGKAREGLVALSGPQDVE